MRSKQSFFIIMMLCAMLALCSCFLGKKKNEGDEVLATVDGSPITLSQFKSAFDRLKSQFPKDGTLDPEGIKAMKMNIINQLIEKEILVSEAKKLGIVVSEAEINEQIKKVFGEYPNSDAFVTRMKEENVDPETWKKEIEYQIMLDKLVKAVAGNNITVTPEEVQKYYTDHQADYNSPTRVEALQIMVETREQAQTILDQIKGGTDFSTLAKTYSTSPDSEKGGDLGYFSQEEMPPFFAVVFTMKPGDLSDVVESEYGFHIFKVIDRKEARLITIDEARPEIEEKIKRAKTEDNYGKWFESIRKTKKIEVNPSAIEKIKM
jgi:peptidyl-prolyl cis-trans isomerase C